MSAISKWIVRVEKVRDVGNAALVEVGLFPCLVVEDAELHFYGKPSPMLYRAITLAAIAADINIMCCIACHMENRGEKCSQVSPQAALRGEVCGFGDIGRPVCPVSAHITDNSP